MHKRKYDGIAENEEVDSRKRFKDEEEEWGETVWEKLNHHNFGSEEELQRRICTINNDRYHYNDPEEHLIINIGDIISNRCNYHE
jgi:hypothetical protein